MSNMQKSKKQKNKTHSSSLDFTKKNNDHTKQNKIYHADDDTSTYISDNDTVKKEKKNQKKLAKPLMIFASICLTIAIAFIALSPTSSINTSDAAKKALSDRFSKTLSEGTVLLAQDEDAEPRDYTISHNYDQNETKIWVWDYAAEDGDYVQILVGGTAITDAFMIKNDPVEITVPAVGDIQVKGIRDGGGGITYAVRYELSDTSYFNYAPVGEFNTYTLIRE